MNGEHCSAALMICLSQPDVRKEAVHTLAASTSKRPHFTVFSYRNDNNIGASKAFQNCKLTRGPRAGRWSCCGRWRWTARGLGRFCPGHETVVSHSRPIAWERRPLRVAGELGAWEARELARAAVPSDSGCREAEAGIGGAGRLLERPNGGHRGERN
jgi:hypothetical protein